MPDPSIMFSQPNAGESFASAFKEGMALNRQTALGRAVAALQAGPNPAALKFVYSVNPQLGMQIEDQLYQRGERDRVGNARAAMSNALLGSGAPQGAGPPSAAMAAPVNALMGVPAQPAAPSPDNMGAAANPAQMGGAGSPPAPAGPQYSEAERQAIQADPEGFLKFQGQRLAVSRDQFKQLMAVHDGTMQLLGGVHDQASYDAAKRQAVQLYSSLGHPEAIQFIGDLPEQYDPQTIHDLQMQGMDTSKQLGAVARENNINSMIETRQSSQSERARHNRAMENRPRSGGRQPAPRPATPTTVIGGIMAKQARGEKLTPAEEKTYSEYRAGRGRGKPSGDLVGDPHRMPDGRVIQYSKSAGSWVDVKTGQKVQ